VDAQGQAHRFTRCCISHDAHADNRFIHCNLKRANILLNDVCESHLADFGFSNFVESGASRAQSMLDGIPQYMALKVHLHRQFDFKVDVCAFGMVM
jgi:serine/threonine protein kinase